MQAQTTIFDERPAADAPREPRRASKCCATIRWSTRPRIATVGYCFGGETGVEFAETGAPIVGTVTIHGSFRGYAPEGAKNIHGPVLILHGSEDPVAPMSEVMTLIDQLRAAKVHFELNLYSGTEHGFSTPKDADEERADSEFESRRGMRFFKQVFGM